MKKLLCIHAAILLITGVSLIAQEKDSQSGIRPAIVVIDIQNQFLTWVPESEKNLALYMINDYIDYFRALGFPVIRVYHHSPEWGPHPDSSGFQFPASVHIKNDDPMIVKNYADAFKKTDLEKILRERKCNTLFLCGLSATGCVLATYFGAKNADFNVFMIRNAVMSHNSTFTNNIQEIVNALDFEAIDLMLKHAEK
ncbi:MAG: isochorismatase family protein [Bacteroidales bacterium]|nr:isochorismatase family protein [Bacteroidales bacterium]